MHRFLFLAGFTLAGLVRPVPAHAGQPSELLKHSCGALPTLVDSVSKYLLISENRFKRQADGTFQARTFYKPNSQLILAFSSLSKKCSDSDLESAFTDLDVVGDLNGIRNNVSDPAVQAELQRLMCTYFWIPNGVRGLCN